MSEPATESGRRPGSRPPLPPVESCDTDALRRLLDHIGRTPIVTIQITGSENTVVGLKLEGANPGRSLKDRVARAIVKDVLAQGRAPTALVDSTSGNFGVAMAWVCRAHGLRFVAICDPHLTPENRERLLRLGAEIEVVHESDRNGDYLPVRIARARDYALQHRALWINQYSHAANPHAHCTTTAPEIADYGHHIDAVFVPASSGGTLGGLGAYFRANSPRTVIVAVDGVGSALFGGRPGRREVNGLGASHASPFVTSDLYDLVMTVSAAEAFACCRALRSAAGLSLGGSSGAALAACRQYLQGRPAAEHVICICPDHGDNYRSTIYSDIWMEAHGHHVAGPHGHADPHGGFAMTSREGSHVDDRRP